MDFGKIIILTWWHIYVSHKFYLNWFVLGYNAQAIFQYQIMSKGGQKMTKMDAIQYIKEVQYTFRDKREKFDKFMDVMKDYKLHRFDQVKLHSFLQFPI